MLGRVVGKIAGSKRVVVSDWTTTQISSGGGEAAGIYRISGSAKDGYSVFPWASILKILPAQTDARDPRWLE